MRMVAERLRSLFRIRRRARDPQSFERLFNQFRQVLESNNRALETINEMGDILGGDYLFDVQYVKRAYAELSSSLNDSLRGFDVLTQNRYPRLQEAYRRIDETISRVIGEPTVVSGELIVFYENITADMSDLVGGKNASLAELRNALKLDVPPAFAVTARAFDSFVQHNRIFEKVEASGGGAALSESSFAELHEAMLHGEIPPDLERAMDKALRRLGQLCGRECSISVRSSAGEEDGDLSFAGQFETILNVPLELEAVEDAYRKVLASLFSGKSWVYLTRKGYDVRKMKMAAACMVMVDAAVSGVLYSADPLGDTDVVVINSGWGLGPSIVEGRMDVDRYLVKKGGVPEIADVRIGEKGSMTVGLRGGGVAESETPKDVAATPSLTQGQVLELARLGVMIETHFRRPQDVEWAIDAEGATYLLQSRPLRFAEASRTAAESAPVADSDVLMKRKGLVVQGGAASGRVFILRKAREVDLVPKGAVLVARHDSSILVRVMPQVSAIITDTGTSTSHMSSLSREFRVPTAVNVGDAARVLTHGQEVTVVVGDGGVSVYRGRVGRLLSAAGLDSTRMEDLHEFRRKRFLLRYIAPLNLVDPLREEFTPEACKTLHDILRFIHEKSVAELIDSASFGSTSRAAARLDLPIPAGIVVIDIGGGLSNPNGDDRVTLEQISSTPLKAVITGMTHPGVWRSDAVPLTVGDFMTSMLRAPGVAPQGALVMDRNVAVVSREYMNLNLKFGYHFTILDCYCSKNARNNHVYFRFAGGATEITKRTRRLRFISHVLGEYGFNIKTKGDLVIARLANVGQQEMADILDRIGRMLSYTRQLDAVMHDDSSVEKYVKNFVEEKYGF